MRLFLGLTLWLGLMGAGLAHDQWGDPNWIAKGHFTSPIDGAHCCGINDCVVLDPNDVEDHSQEGVYIKRLNEMVPRKEVQVSRDGQYWRCKKPDGSRRCFFAPPAST